MKITARHVAYALMTLSALVVGHHQKVEKTSSDISPRTDSWGISAGCIYASLDHPNKTVIDCKKFRHHTDTVQVIKEENNLRSQTTKLKFSTDYWNDPEENRAEIIVNLVGMIQQSDLTYFSPMEVSFYTGGTGWFSVLVFGVIDISKHTVKIVDRTSSGDRCNDGKLEFIGFKWKGKQLSAVQYRSAMTLFRLLNPEDTMDWRGLGNARLLVGEGKNKKFKIPPTLGEWQPYKDISNGASGCIGWVNREISMENNLDQVTGVSVNKKELNETNPDTRVEKCILPKITALFAGSADDLQGLVHMKIEDLKRHLHVLEKDCK